MDYSAKLKALGMKHVELLAEDLLSEVIKPFAMQKIQESENKIDDILLPFLDSLAAEIKKFVDQIDGVEG